MGVQKSGEPEGGSAPASVRAFGKRFDGCPGISAGVTKSTAEIWAGSWVSRNPESGERFDECPGVHAVKSFCRCRYGP